ncbi:MAG: prolipoprotein diacylglyceryl transferase [Bacilli bacterium]|nr:prolipoprotein diacylglyceryl transferase [Bacilli bacterium]
MNSVLIQLGDFSIRWYSILIMSGVIIGGFLAFNEAKKFNISKEYMTNLFFYLIIFGIIGARLYYVAFNWEYYANNLNETYQIWNGGLAIHGGIIAGFIFTFIYTKKYKIKFFRMTDILCVGLIIAQSIGRWGNFMNSEAHGGETSLAFLQSLHLPQFIIEGMHINGIYYQPTFLYESLWCLLGFVLLLIFRRLNHTKIGQVTSLYMIWYGIGRCFVEGLRTDSLMLGEIRVAQLVSAAMIISGIILYIVLNNGSKLENKYNDKEIIDVKF